MNLQVSQGLRSQEKPLKLERFVSYEVAVRERNYAGKPAEFERLELMDFSNARYGIWSWSPFSRGNEFDNRSICDITETLESDLDQIGQRQVRIVASDILPIYAVALAKYHSTHHPSQTPRIRNAPYRPKEREWDNCSQTYLYHARRGLTIEEFRLFLKIFNTYLKN